VFYTATDFEACLNPEFLLQKPRVSSGKICVAGMGQVNILNVSQRVELLLVFVRNVMLNLNLLTESHRDVVETEFNTECKVRSFLSRRQTPSATNCTY
jgi:hypothetical protein